MLLYASVDQKLFCYADFQMRVLLVVCFSTWLQPNTVADTKKQSPAKLAGRRVRELLPLSTNRKKENLGDSNL
jgi:hypothetical protein